MKCEGIQGIRRLAKHHPEVLTAQLHTVTLAVMAEVCGFANVLFPVFFSVVGSALSLSLSQNVNQICINNNTSLLVHPPAPYQANAGFKKWQMPNSFITEDKEVKFHDAGLV